MKKTVFALILLAATSSMAQTSTITGRIFTGMASPQIAPFGAIVDLDKGEVLYVSSIISVLAPKSLDTDCIYEFTYVADTKSAYKSIMLVPPTTTLSCGHNFPHDR